MTRLSSCEKGAWDGEIVYNNFGGAKVWSYATSRYLWVNPEHIKKMGRLEACRYVQRHEAAGWASIQDLTAAIKAVANYSK